MVHWYGPGPYASRANDVEKVKEWKKVKEKEKRWSGLAGPIIS